MPYREPLEHVLDYGFETHSGFSKAFRRRFGCPPEVYRLHVPLDAPPRPTLAHMQSYHIGGIVMEPKFVTLPETRLAGYAIHTTTAEGQNIKDIPAFWVDYMQDGRMERLHSAPFVQRHDEFGACFPLDPATGAMDYLIGVAVADDAAIPAEFATRTLPAATYAVFATPPSDAEHFTGNIQGTWRYIYNEWFAASGYEFAPGCVDFELYGECCMSDHAKVCEIWVPVIKK